MTCGVANGDSTDHLAMAQCVDLTGVAWNTGTNEGVGWEGHRLHLTICADMEGVRSEGKDTCLSVFDISCVTKKLICNISRETLTVFRQK